MIINTTVKKEEIPNLLKLGKELAKKPKFISIHTWAAINAAESKTRQLLAEGTETQEIREALKEVTGKESIV